MEEFRRLLEREFEKYPKQCPRHEGLLKSFIMLLESEGLSYATLYKYSYQLRTFLAWLEDRGLDASTFTLQDLLEYTSRLKSAARSQFIVAAKRFLKFLGRKDLYESVKTPRGRSRPPEVLSREEVLKIIEATEKIEYKALLAVIYECGLRLGEARTLKIKNVKKNGEYFVLRVERSKSMWRIVHVVEFKDLLDSWLMIHPAPEPEAWLFPSPHNPSKPISRQNVNRILRMAAKRAGIRKRVYPHLLRHTRATELYSVFREKELMYLFGWRTRKMIDVYSHLKPEQIQEKYLALYGVKERREKEFKPELVKCPECGYMNTPINNWCRFCGTPLKPNIPPIVTRPQIQADKQVKQALTTLLKAIKKDPKILEKLLS